MHSATFRRWSGLTALIALCGALGLAGATARADEDAGQVTSVIGDTRANDAPLAGGASVGEQERVATGEDGKCSMLVDGNIVIQLCERTKLVLHNDAEHGRRIIQIDAGSAHVIAAPRLAEEHVEIHTPAAIAVLLGTIVHVAVDAVTGDSTITSTHSAVRVRSTIEIFDQETTVNPTQQITVRRGAPPPAQPQQLGPRRITELTTCVEDLREAAIQPKRSDVEDDTITRMAVSEISRNRPPGLAPIRPTPNPEEQLPGEDLNDLENICNPIDCGDLGQQRGQRALVVN